MKKVKHNYLNKKNKKSSCKIFLKKELKIEKTIISQKLKKEKLIKNKIHFKRLCLSLLFLSIIQVLLNYQM